MRSGKSHGGHAQSGQREFCFTPKSVEEDMQRADDMQRRREEEAKPWMDKASYSLEVEEEEIAVAAEMENRRSKHARTVFQASS